MPKPAIKGNETVTDEQPESRGEHRGRVLKRATILGGATKSEIACMIRNMHAHGAELKVGAEASIPENFLLYVPLDGIAYRCRLRWRRSERCGVEILGTEAKPHWHYG